MFEELLELQQQVVKVTMRFDASVLSGEQAAAVVRVAATMKNALAAMELLAAARVAEAGTWRGSGSASAADWLAGETGTTAAQAKDGIETGDRLSELDATGDAARQGTLSPAQATAIADAAKANPGAERELLDAAETESLGELRDRCKQKKAEADLDPDKTHERLRRQRKARTYCDREGAWHLHATNTADEGAVITSVLEQVTDELFRKAQAEGRKEPREAYAADALVEMALRARDGRSDKPNGVRMRYLALIRADLAALVRGRLQPGELCEIAGIGPVPVSVARELLGESIVTLVTTRGMDANVTHLGRGANAAQKIALLWRAAVCQVQGCNRRARLENDHVEPFASVQETALRNLEPICEHHHDLKSYEGWALVAGTGKRAMVPPGDPRHPSPPARGPTSDDRGRVKVEARRARS